jgi:hypothetical protein
MTRTPLRAVLPRELVDRIQAEADRQGIPVEKLVEQALVIGLPRLWALILRHLTVRIEASSKGSRSAVTSNKGDPGP